MDTNTTASKKPKSLTATKSTKKGQNGESVNGCDAAGDGDDNDEEEEKYDVDVWDTLSKSFKDVQTVLDQNRELIQQVNNNHRSKIPDNLAKNVSLIQEINGNISKVMTIYSDISVNFSNIVHKRRRLKNANVETTSTDA